MDFYDLDLNDHVLDALDDMNFTQCTPIQEHAIPHILEGRDLIGVAQTGTGKTAAFLLPILSKLSDGGYPEGAINCIIMSPTRELAQQIDQAMEGFSYYMPVSSVAVYGGNDGARYEQEKKGLAMGADVIIATPGRLISHLSLGNVDLSKVSFFVLDEADRMLDMGFSDDIMQIVSHLPKQRQTIMFSATMPKKIQELANSILNNPAEVKLAVSRPAEKICQQAYVCYETQKAALIKQYFKANPPQRVIIFASSKLKVKDMAIQLSRAGFNVGAMHSDLDQAERDKVMYSFKTQQTDILVATDIVARGIDIDDIQLVVNYDVPHDAEDYVHRIGRTARAGQQGKAITLVSEKDMAKFAGIEHFLGAEVEKIALPEGFGEAPQYDPSAKGNTGGKTVRGKKKGDKQPAKEKGERTEKSRSTRSQKAVSDAVDTPPQAKKKRSRKPQQGNAESTAAKDNRNAAIAGEPATAVDNGNAENKKPHRKREWLPKEEYEKMKREKAEQRKAKQQATAAAGSDDKELAAPRGSKGQAATTGDNKKRSNGNRNNNRHRPQLSRDEAEDIAYNIKPKAQKPAAPQEAAPVEAKPKRGFFARLFGLKK